MRTYLPRLADATLRDRLAVFPAVMVAGPRACGKTTTASGFAATTVRLDVPAEASLFRADPDAALRAIGDRPILIDEWQEVPEVMGAVKRAVDAGEPPGSFILTGSVDAPRTPATWPGTGRVSHLELPPMSVRELDSAPASRGLLGRVLAGDVVARVVADAPSLTDYVDLALTGGFPEPALNLLPEMRRVWYDDYLRQVAARDVPGVAPRSDPRKIAAYIEALSLNAAGVVAHSTIFEAVGINRRTAESYDSVLSRLYLTTAVPAWSTNRLSALTALPKRYVNDPALFAAGARIGRQDILRDGNLLGRLIETFAFAQLRAEIAAELPGVRLAHLRTEKGRQEIDLIVEVGARRIVAVEVKAGSSPAPDDARHLRWLRDRIGDDFVAGVVLHTGPASFALDDRIHAIPLCAFWR